MCHAHFYSLSFVAFTTWWMLVRLRTGQHLHILAMGSVRVRPSWLGRSVLLALTSRSHAPAVFAAVPIAFALGTLWPHPIVRSSVVAIVALYHLNESSSTGRHGEYPLLYTSVAMLLPERWASGAAWGVAVHFILSSGVAKLQVGGREWLAPGTMGAYLGMFCESQRRPPLSRRLSRWTSAQPWALRAIAVGTLLLECGLVPATLLLPPFAGRAVGWVALVGMHVGIAMLMSFQIGLAFMTTLPCYVVGFCCEAPLGSGPWALALLLGLAPTAVSWLRGAPLPEDWPCSGLALFMFNGSQAERLGALFMTRDTRLVLRADAHDGESLIGRPVIHAGLADLRLVATGRPVVHDAVLRTLGFTMLRNPESHCRSYGKLPSFTPSSAPRRASLATEHPHRPLRPSSAPLSSPSQRCSPRARAHGSSAPSSSSNNVPAGRCARPTLCECMMAASPRCSPRQEWVCSDCYFMPRARAG